MAEDEFTYRACSCQAVRTFRLHRPPPVVAEFFAICYTLELYSPGQSGGSERLVARLPWQDLVYARELDHAGRGILRRKLLTAYDVDCGTLAEVIFLRLVRQGLAGELAGPHIKLHRTTRPASAVAADNLTNTAAAALRDAGPA